MPTAKAAFIFPSEENFSAFRDACTDRMHATYADFAAAITPKVETLRSQGIDIVIIDPDPKHMRKWCLKRFGTVDSNSRAKYAAFIASRDERGAEPH